MFPAHCRSSEKQQICPHSQSLNLLSCREAVCVSLSFGGVYVPCITCMPGESYSRLVCVCVCVCEVFWTLINSLCVCACMCLCVHACTLSECWMMLCLQAPSCLMCFFLSSSGCQFLCLVSQRASFSQRGFKGQFIFLPLFKRMLFIRTKTESANFQGNPLYQAMSVQKNALRTKTQSASFSPFIKLQVLFCSLIKGIYPENLQNVFLF